MPSESNAIQTKVLPSYYKDVVMTMLRDREWDSVDVQNHLTEGYSDTPMVRKMVDTGWRTVTIVVKDK